MYVVYIIYFSLSDLAVLLNNSLASLILADKNGEPIMYIINNTYMYIVNS